MKEEIVKVTLVLTKHSIDFFKEEFNIKVKYQYTKKGIFYYFEHHNRKLFKIFLSKDLQLYIFLNTYSIDNLR